MAKQNILLKIASSKVKIAVFKAKLFLSAGIGCYLKRRGLRFAEYFKAGNLDFDITCRNFGIYGRAFSYNTLCHTNKLASKQSRFFKNRFFGLFIKGKLNNTRSVAQVNKYKTAKVSLPLHPTANNNLFADVFGSEHAAVIGSLHSVHSVKYQLKTPLKNML